MEILNDIGLDASLRDTVQLDRKDEFHHLCVFRSVEKNNMLISYGFERNKRNKNVSYYLVL